MTAARKLVDHHLEGFEQQNNYSAPPRKRKRHRIPSTVKVCFLAVCCVALALLYLHQQLDFYYLSMEHSQLQEQVNVFEQRNKHLKLELESQRSLQTVERIARTQLGMVEPDRINSLVIDGGRTTENQGEGWLAKKSDTKQEKGVFAVLATWLNKAFPLGGVEAGTL